MSFGWEGELVRLVPLDPDKHLEHAVRWMNDPEITHYLLVGDFPLTRIAERDWMEARSKSGDTDVVFAIETLTGKHIGFSGIHGISWRNGTAVTGTMLGERSEWGKGFGLDSVATRNRYVFEVLGLRMLYSSVLAGNDRSLKMLKRSGYEECGRMPGKFWKRGSYLDEILVYLDRETWRARSTKKD
ncbi:MAG: GNAT family N-acetyltransferase [Fimbriimonadales bacterium]